MVEFARTIMSRSRKTFLTKSLKRARTGARAGAGTGVVGVLHHCGARPSQAAPFDQKPHPLTLVRSSVGARPSPPAPVDQKPHPLTLVRSSVGARLVCIDRRHPKHRPR